LDWYVTSYLMVLPGADARLLRKTSVRETPVLLHLPERLANRTEAR